MADTSRDNSIKPRAYTEWGGGVASLVGPSAAPGPPSLSSGQMVALYMALPITSPAHLPLEMAPSCAKALEAMDTAVEHHHSERAGQR